MTPLSRFYARFLPLRMVWLALSFSYALALIALVILGGTSAQDIAYIDIKADK